MSNYRTISAQEVDQRKINDVIRGVMDGKTNNTGMVTLTANQATTVVTELRAGDDAVISFMATTANAAAEVGAGTMYISAQGKQTFAITHANNAQADRTFRYTVVS